MDAVHVALGLSKIDGPVGAILLTSGLPNHPFGLNRLLPPPLIDHVQLPHPPKQLLSHPPTLRRATEAIGGDVDNENQHKAGNDVLVAVFVLDGDGGTTGEKEHRQRDEEVGPHPPEQAGGHLAGQQVVGSVGLQDAATGQAAAVGPDGGGSIRLIFGILIGRAVLEEGADRRREAIVRPSGAVAIHPDRRWCRC